MPIQSHLLSSASQCLMPRLANCCVWWCSQHHGPRAAQPNKRSNPPNKNKLTTNCALPVGSCLTYFIHNNQILKWGGQKRDPAHSSKSNPMKTQSLPPSQKGKNSHPHSNNILQQIIVILSSSTLTSIPSQKIQNDVTQTNKYASQLMPHQCLSGINHYQLYQPFIHAHCVFLPEFHDT